MRHDQVSPEQLLECLERSGYLMESRIVRELGARGFFVEPNQVVKDARTGKSREIDLVAEHYSYVPDHRDLCVKTKFVAEVVNNRWAIVLLTSRPSTPNRQVPNARLAAAENGGGFYDGEEAVMAVTILGRNR